MTDLMSSVKQFCSDRLKNENQNKELQQLIRTSDAQKRFIIDEIKQSNILKTKKNCQVEIDGTLVQLRKKNQYTYDLPNKSLLLNADVNWEKVKAKLQSSNKDEIQEVFIYIFNKFQLSRRKAKEIIEIKKSGKRTQKKIPVVKLEEKYLKSIGNYLKLSNESKAYRLKKRKLNIQDVCYENTIKFLKKNNLKVQSFNINTANNQKKRLTIKKIQVAKIKSLSGKTFKGLIQKSLALNKNFDKETFVDSLMDLVYEHLDNTESTREKLVYEIE